MGIIVRGHIVRISGMITGVMKKKRDEDLKLLGARIRQMRQVRGLSQEQLALEAGLDRSYVGGVERGERNITFGLPLSPRQSLLNHADVASWRKAFR